MILWITTAEGVLEIRTPEDLESALARLEGRVEAHLLQAFGAVRRGNPHRALEFFCAWGDQGTLGGSVQTQGEFRVFVLGPGEAWSGLEALYEASLPEGGGLAAVLAAALVRQRVQAQRIPEALSLLERTLKAPQETLTRILLENLLEAVRHLQRQGTVPPYLRDLLGLEGGPLHTHTCVNPFQRIDILDDGGVKVCCSHWLPTEIGNIFRTPLDKILNSPTALDIRRSVLDGSFRYCDRVRCPHITKDELPSLDSARSHPAIKRALENDDFRMEAPSYLLFALDRSCNLSCPSCRTTLVSEKEEKRNQMVSIVEETVVPLLKQARELMFNVAGEFLFSRPSRVLLGALNREDFPQLEVDIITNGTLFTEKEWRKFEAAHPLIRLVRVSVDGATKATFEKLRRGAKWETIQENLGYIQQCITTGRPKHLMISFTYQVDNFREIPDFIEMGKHFGAYFISFERLEMGAFTREEYLQRAVHLPEHPNHLEFVEILRSLGEPDSEVRFDFDLKDLLGGHP